MTASTRSRRTALRAGAVLWLALCAVLALVTGARAATLAPGLAESEVVAGLDSPVAFTRTPDGRLLVAEKAGRVRVVRDGVLLAEPMLRLSVDLRGERGLLGLAVDPDFPAEPYLYVHHTRPGTLRNRVSRFRVSGDTADPAGEQVLLEGPPQTATIHHGGPILFLPDSTMLVLAGENNLPALAQDLTSVLGKALRLNRDGGVPADNPFAATGEGLTRYVWARGFRNPFSAAVQPGTGRVFVNDVGAASWEEIDELVPGADYGWPSSEGPTVRPGQTAPLHAYSSASGAECAITGAAFHHAPISTFPADWAGDFLFADHCAGWIRRLDPATGAIADVATGLVPGTVGLIVEPDGSVLYLTRNLTDPGVNNPTTATGRIVRIVNTLAPTIAAAPRDVRATAGRTVTFRVTAGGPAPFTYRWQRDGRDVPGADGPALTLPDVGLADDGAEFRVVVSNASGTVVSPPARLSVTLNTPPRAAITSPAEGTRYAGGDVLSLFGTGVDDVDGELPDDAFVWRVDLHHGTHLHPFTPEITGRGASVTIPTTGETAVDVWYRVHLTVRDADGATHSVFRDVHPRLTDLTVRTDPPGLEVLLDGSPRTAPVTGPSVVGVERTLAPVSPQVHDGIVHTFTGWSDGGPWERTLAPTEPVTLTARFTPTPDAVSYESGGRVVLDAEDADVVLPAAGASWDPGSSVAGFAGTGYRQALPDAGARAAAGDGPRLRFPVAFATPGTYRVWVRGRTPDGAAGAVHVGLDGVPSASADGIGLSAGDWGWSGTTAGGPEALVEVPAPGVHIVEVWMRDDGVLLDRLLLVGDLAAVPDGTGPEASPRG